MIFGYARVSTDAQDLTSQLAQRDGRPPRRNMMSFFIYTPTHWECEKLLPSGLSWIRLRG
jgi:hypothetical protein